MTIVAINPDDYYQYFVAIKQKLIESVDIAIVV